LVDIEINSLTLSGGIPICPPVCLVIHHPTAISYLCNVAFFPCSLYRVKNFPCYYNFVFTAINISLGFTPRLARCYIWSVTTYPADRCTLKAEEGRETNAKSSKIDLYRGK
jgi:hypothetical protein